MPDYREGDDLLVGDDRDGQYSLPKKPSWSTIHAAAAFRGQSSGSAVQTRVDTEADRIESRSRLDEEEGRALWGQQ